MKTFSIYDQAAQVEYLAGEDVVAEALTAIIAASTAEIAAVFIALSPTQLLEEEENGESNRGLWIEHDIPVCVTTAPSGTSGWGRITDRDVEAIWGR